VSIPEPENQPGGGSPLDAITESELVKEHPEVLVGAAFAGAFVLAKVLKAMGGGR
jgi:hypothetical protein